MLLHGGSGAQYGPYYVDPNGNIWYDMGYQAGQILGVDRSPADWTAAGYGDLLAWGAEFQNFQQLNLYGAAEEKPWMMFYDAEHRFYYGESMVNEEGALNNALNTLGPEAKFMKGAGYVLTFGQDAIEAANIFGEDGFNTKSVVKAGGLFAIDGAMIPVGGAIVDGGIEIGLGIGTALGDGPGAVVGAVVGGLVGAVVAGEFGDMAKNAWKTITSWF
ncbi:MAG: hypothetical protein ACYDCK_03735, partial [Thermoplasmatota archaeon]